LLNHWPKCLASQNKTLSLNEIDYVNEEEKN
jgi:hypothetical protein